MNAELPAVCESLLSAVLNGTVQGILLVLLLAAAFRVFRKMNAATRHGLELMTLVLLVTLPVMHFFFSDSALQIPPSPSGEFRRIEHQLSPVSEAVPDAGIDPEPSPVPRRIPIPGYLTVALAGIWVLAGAIRLGFLFAQLLTLRRWKAAGINAPEPVRELFSKLCVEFKVSRAPQLRVVEKISAPMAVGFKEPAVLLPESLSGSVSDVRLEQILRHELAHVVRRDDWANLFQQIVRAVFFFHPGVIWASRKMTMDREIACDDHVLSALADRKAYALALTELASRKQARNMIAAPAAWGNHSQLKQRITMILDTKRNTSPQLARGKTGLIAAAAMIVAIIAFQAAPRLAFGGDAVEAPPAEPAAPAEPLPPAAVSITASPAPVISARPVVVLGNAPVAHPGAVAIAGNVPPAAILSAPGGGVLFAGALPPDDDEGGPRVKVRAGGRGGDDIERRMERLEKMVESIRRDTEKKNLQYDFQNKFNPPNFNWNGEEFAKMHEKIAKDAEKAARDAAKQAQKFRDFQGYQGFDGKPGDDGMNVQRKTLEEQKRALEQQVRSLERQIQKLEREQQKMEQDRDREQERQVRDKHRAEEKARRDAEEGEAKEKDAK